MREMTLKDRQSVSLEILKDVHDFCVKNGIKYTLFGGTLIGAIRHKGFIPWDDDLDIAFTRPEYEKFVKSYQSKRGFKLFARERQGNEVYISYARVCEMERTFVDDKRFPWTSLKKGIWIDVFPLDGAEEDYNKALIQSSKNYKLWLKGVRIRNAMAPFDKSRGVIGNIKLFMEKIIYGWRCRSYWDKHVAFCKRIGFNNSSKYSQLSWAGFKMREYYNTSALSDYDLIHFEDTEFYIMKGYDGALKSKYGDYMQLPPVEERRPGHVGSKYLWKD